MQDRFIGKLDVQTVCAEQCRQIQNAFPTPSGQEGTTLKTLSVRFDFLKGKLKGFDYFVNILMLTRSGC